MLHPYGARDFSWGVAASFNLFGLGASLLKGFLWRECALLREKFHLPTEFSVPAGSNEEKRKKEQPRDRENFYRSDPLRMGEHLSKVRIWNLLCKFRGIKFRWKNRPTNESLEVESMMWSWIFDSFWTPPGIYIYLDRLKYIFREKMV